MLQTTQIALEIVVDLTIIRRNEGCSLIRLIYKKTQRVIQWVKQNAHDAREKNTSNVYRIYFAILHSMNVYIDRCAVECVRQSLTLVNE